VMIGLVVNHTRTSAFPHRVSGARFPSSAQCKSLEFRLVSSGEEEVMRCSRGASMCKRRRNCLLRLQAIRLQD
jgi:hypothetical protein